MATANSPAEIAILLYPGVSFATVHGLTDLFAVAAGIARQTLGPAAPTLRVSHWRAETTEAQIDCVFDTHPGHAAKPVAVVIPGSWVGEPERPVIERLTEWLVARRSDGATLCSVCGGAFLLAQTGLLAGRTATTHWSFFRALADRFPDVQVDERRIVVEDGDFITAGGVLAWADLGLKLVDRRLGPAIMRETARFILTDPSGREQRHYSNFSPPVNHGDAAILKVQRWLEAAADSRTSVTAMAEICGLEARTFLRRFKRATGLNPTDYCRRARVGKAKGMLELSRQPLKQVAQTVGYEDYGAFRKTFHRIVGLSPSDYRRRFGVA